jgi:hypothetical protein
VYVRDGPEDCPFIDHAVPTSLRWNGVVAPWKPVTDAQPARIAGAADVDCVDNDGGAASIGTCGATPLFDGADVAGTNFPHAVGATPTSARSPRENDFLDAWVGRTVI